MIVYFYTDAVQVHVIEHDLILSCNHDAIRGSIKREINRCYKLPADVDTDTVEVKLDGNGFLHVSAKKLK